MKIYGSGLSITLTRGFHVLARGSAAATAPSAKSTLPLRRDDDDDTANPKDLIPVAQLKPSLASFTIRATVASKSDVNKWSTAKLSGQLFHVMLRDASGTIKATAFNEDVVELFGFLAVGSVHIALLLLSCSIC